MPTYEYLCETCKKQFEVTQLMSEDRLTTHPDCKHKNSKARQIITGGGGFILKGSGWTETSTQTKEKTEKLNKLRQVSHLNDKPV